MLALIGSNESGDVSRDESANTLADSRLTEAAGDDGDDSAAATIPASAKTRVTAPRLDLDAPMNPPSLAGRADSEKTPLRSPSC